MLKLGHIEQELEQNTIFHETVGKVAKAFISANSETFDAAIAFMLKEMGSRLKVDRSYIFQFANNLQTASNTYEWCAEGISSQMHMLQDIPTSFDKWWADKVFHNETIHIPNVDDMPGLSDDLRQLLQSQEIKSTLNVPLFVNETCWGFIGFDAVRDYQQWSDFKVKYLSIVAGLFSEALRRIKAESDNLKVQQRLNLANKMASLGILTAGMGHEINNPLAIISGGIGVLKSQNPAGPAVDILDRMERAVYRISGIIDKLRKVSKKDTTFDEMVDVDACLEDVIRKGNKEKYIQKVYTSNGEKSNTSFKIQGSTELLGQLFEILITNAFEAYDSEPRIEISISVDDNALKILIKDEGKGMSQETLSHVFDAFYTTKDVGEGMGLNLYLAYHIVSLMSGEIDIQSRMGKGTSVKITFPLVS